MSSISNPISVDTKSLMVWSNKVLKAWLTKYLKLKSYLLLMVEREIHVESGMLSTSSASSWEDIQSFASEMREWSIPTIDRYR